jgi:hypothetical protein
MESASMKRAISATFFGLGSLVGIAGCAIYPMAVFTVGANDSRQEVLGISLVFLFLFPTCILALRFRLLAGCMMLLVPCFFIYSSFAQRAFMVNVRHFPQPPIDSKQIIGTFHLTWPYRFGWLRNSHLGVEMARSSAMAKFFHIAEALHA